MTWVTYEAFDPPCALAPEPGTAALAAALLDTWEISWSLGILNCRPPSIHSDGRAFDMALPMIDGRANPIGYEVVARVKAVAEQLGVQEAIYDRKRWSEHYPDSVYYGGISPHLDHIHFSQNKASARSLTYATAKRLLAGLGGEDDDHELITDPIDLGEDDMPRFIEIVAGEPADTNVYGFTDSEWWIATDEEPGSFGIKPRGVNTRQRDVIRSRVLGIGTQRRNDFRLLKVVGEGVDSGRTFAVAGDRFWLPGEEELSAWGTVYGNRSAREVNQRQWELLRQRLDPT